MGQALVDGIENTYLLEYCIYSIMTIAPYGVGAGPVSKQVEDGVYDHLEAVLVNAHGDQTLEERFRALFTLRSYGTLKAIDVIARGREHRVPYGDVRMLIAVC
jgi:hypothetical protein